MLSLDIAEVFQVLKSDKIRELIISMLAHRYRTDILSSYYKLDGISETLRYHGTPITPRVLAEHQIAFIMKHIDEPVDVICQKFWDKMLPNESFSHLQDHIAFETQYSEISALVSDIVLIGPVFKMFANRGHLDVVDVGSGKGNLARMIVAINEINQSCLNDTTPNGHINKALHKTDVFSNTELKFLNTDVYDWQDKTKAANEKIVFRPQKSAFDIPAPDSSQDIAITKWCFHHMTRAQMISQTKNLYRVLKPGGVSVVIEGFMTGMTSLPENANDASMTYKKQLWNSYNQLQYIDIWPEGPWKEDCKKTSDAYLSLSPSEQHAILSFEDYFGHYVLNKRETMPFPFTYIEAEELVEMFKTEGFAHEAHNFLLIGSAPIIRRGPFSAMYIFRKPLPHEQ